MILTWLRVVATFLVDRSSVCQLHVLWLNVLTFTSLMIPSLPWTTRLMRPCAVV